MLVLAFVVLASPFVAQSSPTCSQHASQGASDPGECLLQPANTLQKHADINQGDHQSVIAEEDDEEDTDTSGDEEVEDEIGEAETDFAEGEDPHADIADDEGMPELSALQSSKGWKFDGRCINWFGNGLNWNELKAHGIAEHKTAGVWGTCLNNSWYPKINQCSWDTTAGVDIPTMQLSYYCAGKIDGKVTNCKHSTIGGKNGGGVRTDCYNGLCADPKNVKHDWSEKRMGVTCGRAVKVGPILHLKSPKGNPQLSKWDPNCKVMCESIPECTGFTVNKIRRRPQCTFFTGMTASGYDAWKGRCGTARKCCNGQFPKGKKALGCCNHPHYNTYFVTRKSV